MFDFDVISDEPAAKAMPATKRPVPPAQAPAGGIVPAPADAPSPAAALSPERGKNETPS